MDHAEARRVIAEAWALRGYPDPTPAMLQLFQAHALHESGYGAGYRGVTPPPHNWGSVQATTAPRCPSPSPELADGYCWPCPPGTFEYLDSERSGQRYQACFKRYASDAEGAADTLREVLRRPGALAALQRGSSRDLAYALGGPDVPWPPGRYFAADPAKIASTYQARSEQVAAALGEPLAVSPGGTSGWLLPAAGLILVASLGAVIWWAHDV